MSNPRIVLISGGMVLGLMALLAAAAGDPSPARADRSMDHCVETRAPEWGACGNPDGVKVELRNTCNESIRVHWCVREKSGRLHCGVHPALAPSGTSEARACESERPPELLFEACDTSDRCRVRTGD